MFFSYKSSFFPGVKLGPMILVFIPVPTVPENTRPKAKKRPLSEVGTILEMYIINSPLGSQALIAEKNKWSCYIATLW